MTPLEFKAAWNAEFDAPLIRFPASIASGLTIPPASQQFLTEIGLPNSAAPFLGFGERTALQLPSVTSVYKIGDPRYRIVGENGSGDPVCIDTAAGGRVVYLNHDDGMKPEFMNTSVPQLGYSLLAFRYAVRDTIAAGGEDAYLDGQIPREVMDRFVSTMKVIDADAIRPGQFWYQSILPDEKP